MEISTQVVVVHTIRAKIMRNKYRCKVRRWQYLEARAVLPLRMSYGIFGMLGRDFVGEFYRTLSLRCFDAVVLIK